jgi:hypothetical protein
MRTKSESQLRTQKWQEGGLSLRQAYEDGVVGIHLQYLTGGQSFSGTVRRVVGQGNDVPDIAGADGGQASMLVWVGNVSEVFRPCDSVVRLKSFDGVDVRWRQSSQVLFAPRTKPALGVLGINVKVLDGELGAINLFAGIVQGQFKDEVIQGGPQVLNGIADRQRQLDWNGRKAERRDADRDVLPRPFVIIGDYTVFAGVPERYEQTLRLGEMTIGPLYA